MTRIEHVVHIHTPVEAVWDVLTQPSNIPALYPDALSIQIEPPGRSAVGQRYAVTGRVGRRKVVILSQVTELEPMKRIVTQNTPGGLFRSFEQTINVGPKLGATDVSLDYRYEVSAGYVGKVLNEILVERLVRDNVKKYSQNLKEFSELIPISGE